MDSHGSLGLYTSIALNASNKVYISYYDLSNGDLRYVTDASSLSPSDLYVKEAEDSAGADIPDEDTISDTASGIMQVGYHGNVDDKSNSTTAHSISGYILDENGFPIEGVKLNLGIRGYVDTTKSNTNGLFEFKNLRKGIYRITAEENSYKKHTREIKLLGKEEKSMVIKLIKKNKEKYDIALQY